MISKRIGKDREKDLFFIIGVGRSGTTLLQELFCTFEKKYSDLQRITQLFKSNSKDKGFCNKMESIIWENPPMSCWTAVRKTNDFSLLEEFIDKNWTSRCFVEKTPDSALCLPQLHERFPIANYIFLERNPLDIVLSQINKFPESENYWVRPFHIKNLIMEEKDLALNNEQYWAKATLKLIREIVEHREKFSNKLIIKYEDLENSLSLQLNRLEKSFRIQTYYDKALDVMKKPSSSSINNRYDKKMLVDEKGVLMVKEAQRLYGYN